MILITQNNIVKVMKNLYTILNENKVDDAIDNALSMMRTMEDVEALGEAFGKKYGDNTVYAIIDFLDGVEFACKNNPEVSGIVHALRLEAAKYDK